MTVRQLFVTSLYEAEIGGSVSLEELAHTIRTLAQDDGAGRRWCRDNHFAGYTSYASLDDLPRRDPAIANLAKVLRSHAARFACDLGWTVKPRLDSLWVNLLKAGGHHGGHIHPHAILSGTLYIETPTGAGDIRFEDPRLPMMMAAPVRDPAAPEMLRPFVSLSPAPGTLLLWESWLRHEVRPSTGNGERLSISFNFA